MPSFDESVETSFEQKQEQFDYHLLKNKSSELRIAYYSVLALISLGPIIGGVAYYLTDVYSFLLLGSGTVVLGLPGAAQAFTEYNSAKQELHSLEERLKFAR